MDYQTTPFLRYLIIQFELFVHPFTTLISFDRSENTPVYLQIGNRIIQLIQQGIIQPGVRLPGSRTLAKQIHVNRLTVTKAYDELTIQGWVESQGSRGMFVCSEIPVTTPAAFESVIFGGIVSPGYAWHSKAYLTRPRLSTGYQMVIDEGLPDLRLLPKTELSRAYRAVLRQASWKGTLAYGELFGDPGLRPLLADFIRETRGIPMHDSQIITTRGSTMGIYLAAMAVLKPGDTVVTGRMTYHTAELIFRHFGAKFKSLPLDQDGIRIDALEDICRTQPVRMIYVTPHHHYPTTATMPAERRMQLLQLARDYRFCILEDDYDFDFQYDSNPVMPLISADASGQVIYVGSFSKSIAPALRLGFVVGPTEVITELGKLRRLIDRQGDHTLESAFARLFREGEIRRHLRKAQRTYQERRDHFCVRLENEFPEINFIKPPGGMAVWADFSPDIPLRALLPHLSARGFYLPDPNNYSVHLNATRMGFASKQPGEMDQTLEIFRELINGFGQ